MRITITETTARTCDVGADDIAQALGLSLDQVAAMPAHQLAHQVATCPALAAAFVPDGYTRTEAIDQETPSAGPRATTAVQALDYFAERRTITGPAAIVDPSIGEHGVRCPVCDGHVMRWIVDVHPRAMLTDPEGTGACVLLGGDQALIRLPDGQLIGRETIRHHVDRCQQCGTVVTLPTTVTVTA